MQLTQCVVRSALVGAMTVTFLPSLSAHAAPEASPDTASAATPRSQTGPARGLTWQAASGSTTRVTASASRRAGGQVHQVVNTDRGPARLRSTATTDTSARDFTVWVRTTRARQVVLRAVRPLGPHQVETLGRATVRVKAGVWTRLKVNAGATTSPQRVRLHLRIASMGAREKARISGQRIEWTMPETPAAGTPVAGTLSNGCSYSPRGLPSCGSYLGMAYGSNSDPSAIESALGGRLGLRRTYYTASQVSRAVSTARADLAAGRLPWISFKFPHDWSAMAAGEGDAWARDIAARLATLPGPVWVAFHHEPETDGNIQQWRAAQERLAPIIRSGASNVAFTVVLTGWHQFYGPAEYSLANIWPRTEVDVAGFDIYNSGGVVKGGKTLKSTDLDSAYFSRIQTWATRQGVAWGLAETGFTDTESLSSPDWIRQTHRQLEARGGVAMAYFNTELNSIAPWHLGTSTKQQAYRNAQAGTPRLPVS